MHWENESANLKMLSEKIEGISQTDVIILPEMFTTGFSMNAKVYAQEENSKALQWMKKTAKEKSCAVCGSIMMKEGNHYFNRFYWVNDDESFFSYDKRHLFSLAGEDKIFSSGNSKLLIEFRGWKIFPLICYDLRFPVWSRRIPQFNYDLIIYVANWPERRTQAWERLLPARAIENQCYVAAVNRTGEDGNGINHIGNSNVYDFMGDAFYNGENTTELIHTFTLDKKSVEKFRSDFAFQNDADTFNIQL